MYHQSKVRKFLRYNIIYSVKWIILFILQLFINVNMKSIYIKTCHQIRMNIITNGLTHLTLFVTWESTIKNTVLIYTITKADIAFSTNYIQQPPWEDVRTYV